MELTALILLNPEIPAVQAQEYKTEHKFIFDTLSYLTQAVCFKDSYLSVFCVFLIFLPEENLPYACICAFLYIVVMIRMHEKLTKLLKSR